MEYIAKVTAQDGRWLVEFPDCPGCQTFGDSHEEAIEAAREALEGWLETGLEHGDVPPRPARRRGTGIPVGARLESAIQLRWMRNDLGLTQAQLAKRVGVSQQQIAKLERADANPTIGTLETIARKAGRGFQIVYPSARARGALRAREHGGHELGGRARRARSARAKTVVREGSARAKAGSRTP